MNTNNGRQTEILHRHILANPAVAEHPIGHTSKVHRYRTRTGQEFAVEKRHGNPILLVPASSVRALPSTLNVTTVAAGRKGRNSNLNALTTFRDKALIRLEVGSVSEADELLRHLA